MIRIGQHLMPSSTLWVRADGSEHDNNDRAESPNLRRLTCPSCKMDYRIGINDRLDLPRDCTNCAEIAASVMAGRQARFEGLQARILSESFVVVGETMAEGMTVSQTLREIQRSVERTWNANLINMLGPVTMRREVGGVEYSFVATPEYNGTDQIPQRVRVTYTQVPRPLRGNVTESVTAAFERLGQAFGGTTTHNTPQRRTPVAPKEQVVVDIRARKIELE